MIERVTTERAKELLDSGYTYVDVRTPEEYAAGHPEGAVNVPWQHRVDGRMVLNTAFVATMSANYETNARLVLGCATGKRSMDAAHALIAAGFETITEMRPGYAGIRDAFGQVTEIGWAAAGLPVAFGMKHGS